MRRYKIFTVWKRACWQALVEITQTPKVELEHWFLPSMWERWWTLRQEDYPPYGHLLDDENNLKLGKHANGGIYLFKRYEIPVAVRFAYELVQVLPYWKALRQAEAEEEIGL